MVKLVQGKVEQISIKPIANGPDRFDNTHRKSAKVDGVWYSFGGAKSAKWNVKDGAEFKELGVGSEIAFKAEQSGDFWNAKGLMAINIVPPSASQGGGSSSQGGQSSGGNYTPKPKASTEGVSTGQSVNGAMNFLLTYGVEPSNENIIKYGKLVHSATEKVKAYVKSVNPDATEYEQGARGGLAVLTACKLVGADQDFEQGVEAIAKDLVDNVFPPIMDFVKNGEKQPAPPAKVTRAQVKKPAATKATPVVEEPTTSASRAGFEDMDDDIPFANPMRLSAGLYLAI